MDINEIMSKVDEYYAASQGEQAEKLMCDAIKEAVAQQDEECLLQLLNELLGYYRETSQVEQSYAIADQVIGLAVKMGLENTIPYATSLLNVANAYRAGGRLEDSLDCYEKVRAIYQKSLSPDNMLVASMENNLSLLHQEMGDFRKAKECLLRALPIVSQKEADFEIAVTYANLAGTCMQLGEAAEAFDYGERAVGKFDEMGVKDAHYGAALAALGSCCFAGKEYGKAREYYVAARDIMEQNLGRNEYFYRLQENVDACDAFLESEETAGHKTEMKGLDLCRAYYETCGKPMIETQFKEYADKIAVGLVGEGSDCFGYDDDLSRDHDWGPDFCMWVTQETYDRIGPALKEAYELLPKEFGGYTRTTSPQGSGRRGVRVIEEFYEQVLADWTVVPDYALAAAVNGEVFRDEEGIFSGIRSRLLQGYPANILYGKLAESAARFAQNGQYNYERCRKRGDFLTAQIVLGDCVREAMKLKHYMEGKYPPHDKWLKRSTEELPGGRELAGMLEELMNLSAGSRDDANVSGQKTVDQKIYNQIEKIAARLAEELYAHHLISDTDNYLDAHTEELLIKASVAGLQKDKLVEKIARLEFEAFDKVQNVGGRAECQNNWPTFYVMRSSQYLTWNQTMLLQYYFDFWREYQRGHNLIEEKYGRMMESTAPREYEAIKQHFPEITPQKQAIIDRIAALQVSWMEEFARQYPRMADNARSIRAEEDNLYNTSYETYLRGEISTYSDKMLELYGRYVVEYAREGKNLAYEIMNNSAQKYGYRDVETAERAL